MSIANAIGGLLALSAAVVQYNDPDPAPWIAIYLAAAGSSLLWGRFSRSWLLPGVVAAVALIWAVSIAADMPVWVPPAQMFEPMETKGGAVEMAREVWGLGILSGWMLWLLWRGLVLSRSKAT